MEDDPSPGGDPSRFTYWMFDLEAVLICLTINKNMSISYYTLIELSATGLVIGPEKKGCN